MHHQHDLSALALMFAIANLGIAAGYAATPILVLRYLPLTRTVLALGAVFFVGCAGTHVGMALAIWGVGWPVWLWSLWHVLQLVGTWGFIVTFTRMLRDADRRRRRGGGGAR